MSVHSDKIEKHAVHTSLENVQNELERVKEIQDKTPEAIEVLARMALIVKNFSLALETCNNELIVITWLDDASKALVNIKSYLTAFCSNKDTSITFAN